MFGARLTLVVKNILIINVIMFLATNVLDDWFSEAMAGHWIGSDAFRPWQIITHMFMHGGFRHILFNMIGVFVFGAMLEQVWGPKKFLTYYLLTGLGAMALHFLVVYLRITYVEGMLSTEQIAEVYRNGYEIFHSSQKYVDVNMDALNKLVNVGMVGASGALFGLIIGFAMLFPNLRLQLLFPPIPVKAKTLAIVYGGFELISAFGNQGDHIAHFAHLGGMLFGFIILKYWQKKGTLHSS
jgi:membrane associated rhomboid family serine protease